MAAGAGALAGAAVTGLATTGFTAATTGLLAAAGAAAGLAAAGAAAGLAAAATGFMENRPAAEE